MFSPLMQYDIPHPTGRSGDQDSFIYYLQSQDGNIYRDQPSPSGPPELEAFQKYIKRDVPWMKEAIGMF